MIKVITGNKNLKFRTQGQWIDNITPVRVHLDHNVQVKLRRGTLREYVVPISIPTPIIKKIDKKIIDKNINKGDK